MLTDDGEELRRRGLQVFIQPPPGIAALTRSEQRTLRDLLWKALATEREVDPAA